jgi:hypothetical protein
MGRNARADCSNLVAFGKALAQPALMLWDLGTATDKLLFGIDSGPSADHPFVSDVGKAVWNRPQDAEKILVEAELEHARDSLLALATFGVFKGAGKLFRGTSAPARMTGAFQEGHPGFAERGLGILQGREIAVTEKGLARLEEHLTRFGKNPENTAMVRRLRAAMGKGGRVSGADASFYFHELFESTLMNRGMPYRWAHPAALERYGVSSYSVYHPDVISAFPDLFNSNWKDFWAGMAKRGVKP